MPGLWLAEILKTLPEFGPGHAQMVTQVYGSMINCFFVLNVKRHGNRSDQRAILEIRQQAGVEAH
jgi:hypothetical protein